MHLSTIATALLLPLLAAAQDTTQTSVLTTTSTITSTLTQTLTISHVIAATGGSNSTYFPTGTGGIVPPSPTNTGAPITPAPKSAGNALQVVNVAMAGVVGMVVVALL